MQIILRADASPRIGIGHVRRCLTLARALRSCGADVRFAIHAWGDLPALLAEFAADALILPSLCPEQSADPRTWLPHDQAFDFQEFLIALDGKRPDWIVVDHYALDSRWHNAARLSLGCRILAIDDLADRPLAADIVVDPNWDRDHRVKYRAVTDDGIVILGGPSYAMIDPRYGDREPRMMEKDVGSIGIFMGGTDPAAANVPVLKTVRSTGFAGAIGVVTASLNPARSALETVVQDDTNATLHVDLPELIGFFARHDLCILAAGGTTWERMASGVPAIAVITADNQRAIAKQLADEGLQWNIDAGDWDALATLLPDILADPVSRQAQARRGAEIVDAKGAERVAAALLTLGDTATVMRRAQHADAAMVLEWRNDPYVRSVSRNDMPIELDAHLAWFGRILGSPDHLLLIAEKNGISVGVVRFDRLDDLKYEISLFLNPLLAGRRQGLLMMQAAQQMLSEQVGQDIVIAAETLPRNHASQRLFQKAGYRQFGCHFELRLPCEPRLSRRDGPARE